VEFEYGLSDIAFVPTDALLVFPGRPTMDVTPFSFSPKLELDTISPDGLTLVFKLRDGTDYDGSTVRKSLVYYDVFPGWAVRQLSADSEAVVVGVGNTEEEGDTLYLREALDPAPVPGNWLNIVHPTDFLVGDWASRVDVASPLALPFLRRVQWDMGESYQLIGYFGDDPPDPVAPCKAFEMDYWLPPELNAAPFPVLYYAPEGAAGANVILLGSRFLSLSSVTLTSGEVTTPAIIVGVNPGGTEAEITLPLVDPGAYTLRVEDGEGRGMNWPGYTVVEVF